MAEQRVTLVAPLPPPIGGVTVHVERLHHRLKAHGWRSVVLDYLAPSDAEPDGDVISLSRTPAGMSRALRRINRALRPAELVHVHVAGFGRYRWIAPVLDWTFRRQTRVLTIHSGAALEQLGPVGAAYHARLLGGYHHIIAVSEELRDRVGNLGFPRDRVSIVPAFLPDVAAEAALLPMLPGGRPVVLTSGYLTPLYGYDTLIDCAETLGERFTFVFAFYNQTDAAYEHHILGRLARLSNTVIVRDQPPRRFLALMRRSDAYVRTSRTDGDCVAIREALYFGREVFATDCVKRPEGCHLFPVGDYGALHRLLACFKPQKLDGSIRDDPFPAIIEAYDRAMHQFGLSRRS